MESRRDRQDLDPDQTAKGIKVKGDVAIDREGALADHVSGLNAYVTSVDIAVDENPGTVQSRRGRKDLDAEQTTLGVELEVDVGIDAQRQLANRVFGVEPYVGSVDRPVDGQTWVHDGLTSTTGNSHAARIGPYLKWGGPFLDSPPKGQP